GETVSDAMEPFHFQMQRGDVVVLYSDGLNEAVNLGGDEYGNERLADAVRKASNNGSTAIQIREAILGDVATFVADAEPHDDMTLVVVRRR
ncbi:MAG: SpoIIE family protein phosphatase, partial [bacterium]|nr:SpoIIE family protein phosphatase [Candidatus Kapabacteria bacterium]